MKEQEKIEKLKTIVDTPQALESEMKGSLNHSCLF